jgi:predicted Fe-Mo cluster-binding NifX family protein
MRDTVELLADCRYVLVSQIGTGAESKLKAKGIQAMVAPNFIDEALQMLTQTN